MELSRVTQQTFDEVGLVAPGFAKFDEGANGVAYFRHVINDYERRETDEAEDGERGCRRGHDSESRPEMIDRRL